MSALWHGLLALKKASIQNHPKGSLIASADTPLPGLFHVEQGQVGLYRAGLKLAEIGAGTGFGEVSLFADLYLEVRAEKESILAFWPKGLALLQLKSHTDLALAFAALAAQKGQEGLIQSYGLRTRSARQRILHHLASLRADQHLIETGCLSKLAAFLGLAQESLYRELKNLEKEGRIYRPEARKIGLNPEQSNPEAPIGR